MTKRAMSLEELNQALYEMANAQPVSPEYERLYAVPLNRAAGRIYILQRAHYSGTGSNLSRNGAGNIRRFRWLCQHRSPDRRDRRPLCGLFASESPGGTPSALYQ